MICRLDADISTHGHSRRSVDANSNTLRRATHVAIRADGAGGRKEMQPLEFRVGDRLRKLSLQNESASNFARRQTWNATTASWIKPNG